MGLNKTTAIETKLMLKNLFGKDEPSPSECPTPESSLLAEEVFLKNVVTSTQAIGDVIFIHSMWGDWQNTWRNNEHTPHWANWLAVNRPDLNFWSLQYPASPTFWAGRVMSLPERSVTILALLKAKKIGQKPLSFVTHSMGGLLCKQMLMDALTGGTETYKSIGDQTCGVAFLSTPHTGADLASKIKLIGTILRPTEVIEDLIDNEPGSGKAM